MSDELDARLCLYVKTYNDIHGHGPAQKDIAERFEYRSLTALRRRLYRLRDEQRLTWEPNTPRSLRTVEAP